MGALVDRGRPWAAQGGPAGVGHLLRFPLFPTSVPRSLGCAPSPRQGVLGPLEWGLRVFFVASTGVWSPLSGRDGPLVGESKDVGCIVRVLDPFGLCGGLLGMLLHCPWCPWWCVVCHFRRFALAFRCAGEATISDHFNPKHQNLRPIFGPKFLVQNYCPCADITGGRELGGC